MPKLTLRELFAIVTIVALAVGWALDHSSIVATNERLRRQMYFLAGVLDDTGHAVSFENGEVSRVEKPDGAVSMPGP